jgi:hypothetical protein
LKYSSIEVIYCELILTLSIYIFSLFSLSLCSDFEDELERGYGLELPGRNDVGVGLRDGTNFYKMTTKFSTDNVRAFVESWSRGELAGLEQQQAELEQAGGGEEYTGPTSVVTLTNDNFQQEVTETNKDVLVEFYGKSNKTTAT